MDKKEFKPYIPADKVTKEFTITSVIFGSILAVVFGAANAYLGLRVGLTVSASIPAAVISMAIIRVILKRDSILESNMVQTIGSAGESLASGVIFTMPVLYLWAKDGIMESPSLLVVTIAAICGGLLGVCFMVPLRKALIVKEHGVLPYPEGTACADVLLAGEEGGSSAKSVFAGMGIAAVFKFLADGVKVIGGVVTVPIKALKTAFSVEAYPALIGVGYICGPKIAKLMFAGGMMGWFVLIPAISTFGGDLVLYPADVSIAELYQTGGPSAIWSNYIRYIGAGAVATAGIISLCKTLPLIVRTFRGAVKGMKVTTDGNTLRTEQDLSIKFIGIMLIGIILLLWLVPVIPVSLIGAVMIAIFGFFFATVASRMVGLVGSSNNPVSGMAIATLIISTALLKATGDTGIHGMQGALIIGAVICVVASMSGDMSQDLKTGYILGATPKKQQIGEIIGTVIAALAIGGILYLLDSAWGFGSETIPAPQATLMKMIVEGVMNGNLPWTLIFIGVFIAIFVEIIGISALPVSIGLYLPLELTTTIMLGGLVRLVVDKRAAKKGKADSGDAGSGILFCSGMIAGEGLVGILLAIFAVLGIDKVIDLSDVFSAGQIGGIVAIALMVIFVCLAQNGGKKSSAVK